MILFIWEVLCMKRGFLLIIIISLLVTALIGCSSNDKYKLDSNSNLTKDDMKILQKKFDDLTSDEKTRLITMKSDMTAEEMERFKDDFKRLYLEEMEGHFSSREVAEEAFEEGFDYDLREKKGELTGEELEQETAVENKEIDRKSEIEKAIKDRINEGYYHSVSIEEITINDDMGKDEEGYYIALIKLYFEIKNRRKTANEMMRMYSDDLVATLANKGIEDISEVVVFWKDEYNDRSLKYVYEYKDGGFYIADIMGE